MTDTHRDEPDAGAANRGTRAGHDADGQATGSGAGAGGSSTPEDIDSDSASGAGANEMPRAPGTPNAGGDASNHGSR